jgi:acyl dehydratase
MALSASALTPGEVDERVVVDNLTRTQIVQYAGASGDYNPVHTDEIYATQAAGYPTVFAHGMLTMGLTGRMLTDLVGDGRLTRFGVRFTRQVWPGDTLRSRATVDGIRRDDGEILVDLVVETVNQHDEVVMSGYATARVDP